MTYANRREFLSTSLALALPLAATQVRAQSSSAWPQKTIKILVPNPAGGSADLFPRLISEALMAKLTGREAQVLERIVAGRLNKQIADDLGISIKTVEAHRANIMEKLNANTVADLLKTALGQNAPKA